MGAYPKDGTRQEQIDYVLSVAPNALGQLAIELDCNIAVVPEGEPVWGVFVTKDPDLIKVIKALFDGNNETLAEACEAMVNVLWKKKDSQVEQVDKVGLPETP